MTNMQIPMITLQFHMNIMQTMFTLTDMKTIT